MPRLGVKLSWQGQPGTHRLALHQDGLWPLPQRRTAENDGSSTNSTHWSWLITLYCMRCLLHACAVIPGRFSCFAVLHGATFRTSFAGYFTTRLLLILPSPFIDMNCCVLQQTSCWHDDNNTLRRVLR